MGKSKRSKATDIPKHVKENVWDRDGRRCVFCGSPDGQPNAHIVPRSKGGLGVEKNIITLCWECHYRMDHTPDRQKLLGWANNYLVSIYGSIDEGEIMYDKTYRRFQAKIDK